ncbi:MAG: HlyD family efflux transporter periplasmic adaptor subunit, partial [Chitinivibrionales bacterium]|nr:HlyD family efflux transporter periplasmic adaptor subunit [Chitinivibrionales bacterium]
MSSSDPGPAAKRPGLVAREIDYFREPGSLRGTDINTGKPMKPCNPLLSAAPTLLTVATVLCGCGERVPEDFLGSAVVDVRTYEVGTTVQGPIASVYRDEGQRVERGDTLALVDTVPLRLSLDELRANYGELNKQIGARRAEVEAAKSEVRGLKREVDRIRNLVEKGSAPAQQLDKLETNYESAQFKLKGAESALASVASRRQTLHAKEAQLREQLHRCRVKAPVGGIVLTRYRSEGEIAGPAAPLFEIGSYDTVWADFFVPQPVLGALT